MASMTALRGFADEVNSRFVFAGLALVLSLMLGIQAQSFEQTDSGSSVEVKISVQAPGENFTRQATVGNSTNVLNAVNSTYNVSYTESSMGYFIDSIHGFSSNSTHYWLYFVNNETPEVGVGQYTLETEDQVTFRYLSLNESRKYTQ